jgi:hypothetical protein
VSPTPLHGIAIRPDRMHATLASASWNVIRLERTR